MEQARKFATEDEALAWIIDTGDTPVARALAEAWEIPWAGVVPLLKGLPEADPAEQPALALEAFIAAGDAEQALWIATELAEEMPFVKVVEDWVCGRIAELGAEAGKEARASWRGQREAWREECKRRKSGAEHWSALAWADMMARAQAPKLKDLAARLEVVKPAEPKVHAEPQALMDVPLDGKKRATGLVELPGAAGELQDYYLRTSMQPSPILSVIPGLIIPTVLACENVIGPSGPKGCDLHQILAVLAPTSGGKQSVIDLIMDTLIKVDRRKLIGPNRFKSGAAVVKWVKRNPTSICVPDEFGAFLAKLGNPKSNPCEVEINERFREFWSRGHASPYTSAEGASEGDDSEFIENPHLNVVGFGNRDEFFGACKAPDIVNGFLNRIGVIEEQTLIKIRTDFEEIDLPPKLLMKLMKIRDLKRRRLEWGPGAKEVYQAELDWVFAQEDDRQRKLWSRSPERLVRTASSFAVSRLDTRVLRTDMEVAKALMDHSNGVFKAGIEDAEAKRMLDHADLRIEVCRRLKAKAVEGWGSDRDLKKSFQHNTRFKTSLKDAIDDMLNSGTLVTEVLSTGGRNKTVYRVVED